MRRARVRVFPLIGERNGMYHQKRLHAITNASHDVAYKQPQRTFYESRVVGYPFVRLVLVAIWHMHSAIRCVIVHHLIVESL